MKLPCFQPEGAFYIFPDVREFGMSSEEFAVDLLKEEKVAVVPGSAFGDSGEGFIRISYAYSIAELKEALLRIERYWKFIYMNRPSIQVASQFTWPASSSHYSTYFNIFPGFSHNPQSTKQSGKSREINADRRS